MKYIPTNPKRSIHDISSLYLSNPPAGPFAEPNTPVPADASPQGAACAGGIPLLTLALVSDSDPFAVGLSYCRWLSLAFDSLTMIAEPPSSSWMRHLHRRKGTSRYLWGESDASAEAVQDASRLQIVLSTGSGDPDLALDAKSSGEAATREWPSIAERLSGPSSAIVRTLKVDSWSELGPVASESALWACLLPPQVEAFIAYYTFVKARREAGDETKFYAIIDRSIDPEGYRRIEDTWCELTSRFLGNPVPLLGEIDGRLAAGAQGVDGPWLRMCEENLGPPWPSDLQAMLGADREEVLSPARGHNRELHGTRLYDKVQTAGGIS